MGALGIPRATIPVSPIWALGAYPHCKDFTSAKLNLQKLEGICPDGCEAFYTLQTAIEKFKDGSIVWSPPEKK